MRFGILGPVEAWFEDEPVALGGPRQLALLALLILNANRAVSTDALIEGVWRTNGGGAGKRLSVAVARLRRTLGPLDLAGVSRLRTVGGGYMLSLGAGELDADRFEAQVKEGLDALSAGEAAQAGGRLRAALALWRGPALAGVRFEDFAQSEITRLEELRLLALEARIDADLQIGQAAGLVGELRSLLAVHPTRERLVCLLMLALYRSGRQAEALDIHRSTRAHLARELGLEPGPELRRLQAEILEQSPALDVAFSRAGLPPRERAMVGKTVTMVVAQIDRPAIPAPDGKLIGREDEHEQLMAALGDRECRLITITGPGGAGKTCLALAVAGRIVDVLADGAFLVALAQVSDPPRSRPG